MMELRQDKTIPSGFLAKLMHIVSESSVFVFDEKMYIQLMGVAMGSRVSPTFACLFVGVLEAVMKNRWEQISTCLLHLFKRFIDNVFFLWKHGEAELERFFQHLNSSHPHIKFEVVKGESYNFET